jgi:hypothetical protein
MSAARDFFRDLQDLFKVFISRKGMIEFTTGKYEVFMHTRIKRHEQVYFRIEKEHHHHTCSYLPEDDFEIIEGENGFTVIANIESNKVKFYWHVK